MMKKIYEKHKSFILYSVGGVFKTGITILLLYLFIDKYPAPWPNTYTRIIILGTVFLATYKLYDWIGYSK